MKVFLLAAGVVFLLVGGLFGWAAKVETTAPGGSSKGVAWFVSLGSLFLGAGIVFLALARL